MEELHRRPSLVPVFVWRGSAIGRIVWSCGSPSLAHRPILRIARLCGPFGCALITGLQPGLCSGRLRG